MGKRSRRLPKVLPEIWKPVVTGVVTSVVLAAIVGAFAYFSGLVVTSQAYRTLTGDITVSPELPFRFVVGPETIPFENAKFCALSYVSTGESNRTSGWCKVFRDEKGVWKRQTGGAPNVQECAAICWK